MSTRVPGVLILLFLLCIQPMAQATPVPNAPPVVSPALTTPTAIHHWSVDIILLNFDESIIDTNTLLASLPLSRDYDAPNVDIHYDIEYRVTFAPSSFTASLRQFMLDHSVSGPDIGTELNVTALEYQKAHPDEPQRIFYPGAGRCIDGNAVEEWLLDNPPVDPPALGYVLYLLNFSEFDASDHSFEHWYDYHPVDPDSGRPQDFFRLEWDNDLNSGVKFEYAGFGGEDNMFVLDPTADQWYLRWAATWWGEPPYSDQPEYAFKDLDTLLQEIDATTSEGMTRVNLYLAQYMNDVVSYLFFPTAHAPIKYVETGRLKSLVFCMDVKEGISVDSLRWVTNAAMQRDHLEELIPFINWTVEVDFLDIDDYPDWMALFDRNSDVIYGKTIVDGAAMFGDIYDNMRPLYVGGEDYGVEVFGVVFIKKNMVMTYAGRTFTGLGGGGQTVIWKSWERYYLSDGVTRKAGVSVIQLHETMHAIGFGHTWEYGHYAGDFSSSPMGYFAFHNGTSSFDQNWAQSTYLDQMAAEVSSELENEWSTVGQTPSPRAALAHKRALEMIDEFVQQFDNMNWSAAHDLLMRAQYWKTKMHYAIIDNEAPRILNVTVSPDNVFDVFDIMVTASGTGSPVERVHLALDVDGSTADYDCEYNGHVWVAHLPPVNTEASLVRLTVTVSDWGMNNASQTITLFKDEPTPEHYPMVIAVTAVTLVTVMAVVVVLLWHRRRAGL
ncbi:MAG: hypothetical protein ACTSVD_08685 [Candidatus Thorarchaeota archaeon]